MNSLVPPVSTGVPAIANYYAHYFMNLLPHLLLKRLMIVYSISYLLDACQIGQAQKILKNLIPSWK